MSRYRNALSSKNLRASGNNWMYNYIQTPIRDLLNMRDKVMLTLSFDLAEFYEQEVLGKDRLDMLRALDAHDPGLVNRKTQLFVDIPAQTINRNEYVGMKRLRFKTRELFCGRKDTIDLSFFPIEQQRQLIECATQVYTHNLQRDAIERRLEVIKQYANTAGHVFAMWPILAKVVVESAPPQKRCPLPAKLATRPTAWSVTHETDDVLAEAVAIKQMMPATSGPVPIAFTT